MKATVELFGQRFSRDVVVIYGTGALVCAYVLKLLVSKFFRHFLGIAFGFSSAIVLLLCYTVLYSNAHGKGPRHRPLRHFKRYEFLKVDNWSRELVALTNDKPLPTPLYPDSFVISDTLDVLIENIIRDFVLSWYRKFSNDTLFPAQVDNTLRQSVQHVSSRISEISWADVLVRKILPIITEHLNKYVAAEEAVKAKSLRRQLTESKELEYAIAKEYSKLTPLHPAISLQNFNYESPRKNWLGEKLDGILPDVLIQSEAEYKVVFELVKNIIGGSVIFPVANMLSDPDFWNQNVVKMAGSTLRDEKRVRELRQALDAHATSSASASTNYHQHTSKSQRPLKLKPNADNYEFERFLRNIKQCQSLAEARQTRYYVSVQLKRTTRSKDNNLYVHRLSEAKYVLDKQIAILSGGKDADNGDDAILPKEDPRENYNLQDILNDPACLLYFMEFMDQRKRTLLLQFCITVNSLKMDPLENDIEDEEVDPLGGIHTETGKKRKVNSENEQKELMSNKNDIIQIYNTYFSQANSSFLDEDIELDIRSFATNDKPTFDQYRRARRALIKGQDQIYRAISKRDLSRFKKSDYFLKYLASAPDVNTSITTSNSNSGTNSLKSPDPLRSNRPSIDELQMDAVDNESNNDNNLDGSVVEYDEPAFEAVEEAFNDIMNTTTPGNKKAKKLFDDSDNEDELVEDYMVGGAQAATGDKPQDDSELHLAAPGDLGLTEAIDSLNHDIEKLYSQEAVLESLLQKAELTNTVSELRILKKSLGSLEREIERKELQRQQYIVQESDNSLYGRSDIKIQSYMTDNNGEYILYIIEVQKFGIDGTVSAGWIVARRYSQFFDLHNHLRATFPHVQKLSFPKKQMVLKFHQQKSLVESRKISLERYLKQLLTMPDVCRSKAFRLFLSSETFSTADCTPERIITSGNNSTTTLNALSSDDNVSQDSSIIENEDVVGGGDEYYGIHVKPFVQPICDLFIQLFGLHNGNNSLRGRAVVVVLQQLLGGTIEKKIRDHINEMTTIQSISGIMQSLIDNLWPNGGQFKQSSEPRNNIEKTKTKHDARIMLQKLVIGLSSRVIGSSAAKYAATNVFSMYQNEILNSHLIYSVLDSVLDELYPPK